MKRIALAALLLITAVIALEPFGIVMPTSTQMTAAGVLLGVLIVCIGVLWQEKPADEREESLLDKRGRQSFYVGLVVGSIGVVVSAFQHKVEWWLAATIGSMLIIKLLKK